MPDPVYLTSVSDLHAAICARVQALDGIAHAGAVPREVTRAMLPGFFLEIEAGQIGRELDSGLFPVDLEFTGTFLMPRSAAGTSLDAASGAFKVMRLVHGAGGWGFGNVEGATDLNAEADPFRGTSRGGEKVPFDLWVVTWRQVAHLADMQPAVPPEMVEIWLGWHPDVGPEHIEDYEKVGDGGGD